MKIDKIYHFVVSYALMLTVYLVFPLAISAAMVFAIGVAKEIYDYADYGLFDVKDLVADGAGITFAVVIISLSGQLNVMF